MRRASLRLRVFVETVGWEMIIRVAIADDHPVVLAGLEYSLSSLEDIQLVGRCSNSTELVELVGAKRVDVVVTDFSMSEGRYGDGITMLRFLKRRFPHLRLVVLTAVESRQVMRSIQDCGIRVILGKADDHDYLGPAIRHAHQSEPFLSPAVEAVLEHTSFDDRDSPPVRLTKRETEVVRMLAEGLSIPEIGVRVGRSRKTVSSQKSSAMKKLGLSRNADLFRYAVTSGLVQASQVSRGPIDSTEHE